MGDAQEGNRKGKARTAYSNWSIEVSKILLQLMVDAASRGWCDMNGILSKAIVESRILPILNEKLGSGFGWDATTKKFTAPEESHLTHRGLRNKNCDDYEDLQIVIGNATATGKNSLGLSDETDARIFGVEDKHTALGDFVYDEADEANEAFVSNLNESLHQPPPFRQSSSPLPFSATSLEVHPVSTSQKK
ncbi:hypothetical protein Dsin_028964 [Dipteronia sinensis]|uniref:Myb/SANT-like domain-containing protein n=1 Tax=Dipteronia sinensis TaxID=43782 RepID=A0AAD9ZRF8_9ROSI|nr:hypothetical protein Dsin_028964 [Dipteronia sinensis]